MLVGAYAAIVILTWILVIMNVRAVVQQYQKDLNANRLYSYLLTLLILSSVIISVASAVVQRVIDSESYMRLDSANSSPVRYYRR
jgi:hypothetical protein